MVLPKYCYKIVIAYDGTEYAGWQIQKNGLSIQAVIQNTMEIVLNDKVAIRGSGRTDSKVHAENQVAHFHYHKRLDHAKFLYSLNSLLPLTIRIKSIDEVDDQFHAQYSAKGKVYHYHIHLDKVSSPFNYRFSWHVHHQLDIKNIKEAAKLFIGKHDFTSFANESNDEPSNKNGIRHLTRLDVIEVSGGIRLEFEGEGFLYKMVRNITGFLVEVGRGRRKKEEILEILQAKDRTRAGPAAPSTGLFLMEVYY